MLTVTIPLPPKGCAQNSHAHWRIRAKAEKEYRRTTEVLAVRAASLAGLKGLPPFKRITITPTFYCGRFFPNDGLYRPLDSTNAAASLKAAVDGLVDAGVVASDDHRTVRMMPPVLNRTKKEHQGRAEVVLEIEEWVGNTGEGA